MERVALATVGLLFDYLLPRFPTETDLSETIIMQSRELIGKRRHWLTVASVQHEEYCLLLLGLFSCRFDNRPLRHRLKGLQTHLAHTALAFINIPRTCTV